jgi:hypothetical protein
VRLEDTDGDGKFDKSTVFADKMMFPEGAMAALRVMARANLKSAPPVWAQGVATALRSADPELVQTGVGTARNLAPPKADRADHDKALMQIGGNPAGIPETRLEALAANRTLDGLSAGLFDFIISNVDPAKPWAIRNNAATKLSQARLDQSQLLVLANTLPAAGPLELSKLINEFTASNNETVGTRLAQGLLFNLPCHQLPRRPRGARPDQCGHGPSMPRRGVRHFFDQLPSVSEKGETGFENPVSP